MKEKPRNLPSSAKDASSTAEVVPPAAAAAAAAALAAAVPGTFFSTVEVVETVLGTFTPVLLDTLKLSMSMFSDFTPLPDRRGFMGCGWTTRNGVRGSCGFMGVDVGSCGRGPLP